VSANSIEIEKSFSFSKNKAEQPHFILAREIIQRWPEWKKKVCCQIFVPKKLEEINECE